MGRHAVEPCVPETGFVIELPLFPLHTVLSPGLALPLHVFEDRYRLLTKRSLDDGTPFGIVLIRRGREVGGPAEVRDVGTVAHIRKASRHADGRYDIVVVGGERFRIERVDDGRAPYAVGTVRPIAEAVGDSAQAQRMAETVSQRFIRYLERFQEAIATDEGADGEIDVQQVDEVDDALQPDAAGGPLFSTTHESELDSAAVSQAGSTDSLLNVARRVAAPHDPVALSHLLSGLVQIGLAERQALLEEPTALSRLVRLDALLRIEIDLLGRGLRPLAVDVQRLSRLRN